jgi:DnaJ homolog subfamily C member 3
VGQLTAGFWFNGVLFMMLLFSRASTIKVDNIPALLRIAILHTKLGEVEAALGALHSCTHLDPEHKECIKQFKRLRKLEKAFRFAEDAMKRAEFRNALGEQGLDVDMTGKKGALPIMKELGAEGAVKKKAAAMICECNARLKRTNDAIKKCSEALELDENNVDVLCNRADAYMANEQFEEALRDFTKAKEASGGQMPHRVREGLEKAQRLYRQSLQKDYYKVLGVGRDASERDIKRSYRKLAGKYHPDKYDGPIEEGEKKMTELNQAYEVLSNKELRARFDAGDDPNDPMGGQGGQHPFGGGGQHPFFFQQQGGGGGSPFSQFFQQGHGGGGGGGFQFHFQ